MDLKISVKEMGETERSITIGIPREVYRDKFDRALSVVAGQAKIKGFRPGRVPKAMVAKLYGEKIHSDVVSEFVATGYSDAIKGHSLKVVGYPRVNMPDDQGEGDLEVTADVTVRPEPVIRDYLGVKFESEIEEVTDDAVEKGIEQVLLGHSKIDPVEARTTVEEGDLVTLDFIGSVDGEPVEGLKGEDAMAEASPGGVPKGFNEGLIGSEVGEEKSIKGEFPEDFRDEKLAGKTVDYAIKIKAINTRVIPELSDEFVKERGFAEDVESFRSNFRERLSKELTQRNSRAKEEKLFELLIESNAFEVPQVMIDEEIRSLLFEMRALDPSKEESYRIDVTPFREHLSSGAETRVKRSIILQQIIEQEQMKASDGDLTEWLDEMAESSGQSREELDKLIGFPERAEQLRDMVLRERMIKRLLDEANVTEIPVQSKQEE